MKLHLKSIVSILTLAISFIIIPTVIAMESQDESKSSDRSGSGSLRARRVVGHSPLPADTIIVGCNGVGCNAVGPLILSSMEVLELGWHSTEWLQQGEGRFIRHNHGRQTLDLLPQHSSLNTPHFQGDWLNFELEQLRNAREGCSCVFLEKLPPVGPLPPNTRLAGAPFHVLKEDGPNFDLQFMPKAIEKARQVLNPGGRLVINLVLDILFYPQASAEDLKKSRAENPFCGHFNGTLETALKEALALYRSDEEADKKTFKRSRGLVYEGIHFYNQQMEVALAETLRTNASAGPDVNVTPELAENIFRNEYDLSRALRKPEDHPAYDALLKICFVLKQKELMVQYLSQHGFEGARVEWLNFSKHHYNKSAGFFVTAIADGGAL